MTPLSHPEPRGSMAVSRAWRGAAILSRGFRPFFLAAGIWALVGVALWQRFLRGRSSRRQSFRRSTGTPMK